MQLPELILLFVSLIFVSAYLTSLTITYSLKYQIYDIPGERSSHDVPKPKCGGIPIVLIFAVVVLTLGLTDLIEERIYQALLFGVVLVAITGFMDDLKNLSAILRATVYIIAAGFSLYLIDGYQTISINQFELELGIIGSLMAVVFIVWLTNLYNFMDGTDGFAAVQTISVSAFCCFIFFDEQFSLLLILTCLLSSTFGFLYWNWAPAKIFMGDVGSCSIGFLFGLLAIYTAKTELLTITVWLILLAPFIADSTFTLIKRVMKKEKWYQAHNSHAYQKIYRMGVSHGKLAMKLLFLNIFIVWPLAYLANKYQNLEIVLVSLVYAIMLIIWFIVDLRFINTSIR